MVHVGRIAKQPPSVAVSGAPLGDTCVGVGVDDDRAPALGGSCVTGVRQRLGVDPPDHIAHRAEIQQVVVEPELQMVGVKARVDERDLFCVRVVVGGVTGGPVQRIVLGKRVARAFPTPVGVARAPNLVGHPDAPAVVHHRVVRVPMVGPDQLVAVVQGKFPYPAQYTSESRPRLAYLLPVALLRWRGCCLARPTRACR